MQRQNSQEQSSDNNYLQTQKELLTISFKSYADFQETIRRFRGNKKSPGFKTTSLLQQQNAEHYADFEQWRYHYLESVSLKTQKPFQTSIHLFFRSQLWFIMFFQLFGFLCHSITPYLLLLLYKDIILHQATRQSQNLVYLIILVRVLRVICSYYGQLKLNELGTKMYRLVTYAVIDKTLKCSLLTNKKLSSAQLIKMMHSDCAIIMSYPAKLAMVLDNFLNFVIQSAIILHVSGFAGLAGIFFMVFVSLLRMLIKQQIDSIDKSLQTFTVSRVKATIQSFRIIKYIKTNALQLCYFNKLKQLRIDEVKQLKKKLFIEMIHNAANFIKPLATVVTVKLLIANNSPHGVQIVFTVYMCVGFTNMQIMLNALSYLNMIQTSFDTIQSFMQKQNADLSHIKINKALADQDPLRVTNGNFSWNQPSKNQSQYSQFCLKNINLSFKKYELVAIVGPNGSGKSSFLNSLIGQMNKIGSPSITINGTIAYLSQTPWIMNDTIRSNILFGKQYNHKRYLEAIKYASLQSDLVMFPYGDMTMIGKRGSTLSGGQKARVSLARALYADSDIYILDDILSAVDAHVGAFLFSITIKEYLSSKTVLLVTHSLYHVSHADRVLIFQNGEIVGDGSFESLKEQAMFRKIKAATLKEKHQYENILNRQIDMKQITEFQEISDQLDRQIGALQSFKVYIRRNSGICFLLLVIIYVLLISLGFSYAQIDLNKWVLSPTAMQEIYFIIQILINVAIMTITIILGFILYFSSIFQSIHDDMIRSLLYSPLSFFERASLDKIISRLSNDLSINDKVITSEFNFCLVNSRLLTIALINILYVLITYKSYYYILFLVVFVVITGYFFFVYISLSNRIRNIQRDFITPVNSKYSEVIDGLSTIRAYRNTEKVTNQFQHRIDTFSFASLFRSIIDARVLLIIFISGNLLPIIQVLRLSFLHAGFQSWVIFFIFNIFSIEDSLIKVNQSIVMFGPVLQCLGKCEELTKLKPQQGFVKILQNAQYQLQNQPWNKIHRLFPKGQIVFQNYSFRYRSDLPNAINNLNLSIRPGEKLGIVGRTGSGKSSLMLGLLRIVQGNSGKILIDGIDIAELTLDKIRSNINIILQDHFMFAGTIRKNVDPSESATDTEIQEALQMCGIWQAFASKEGLDTHITQDGDNLSSGQKQLINIARSFLNPKKIVLIDEATASIDIESDKQIQQMMNKKFVGRTVLIIAHRINTVMDCDRILVLSEGTIAELDSPSCLLRNPNSLFRKLYEQSGKGTQD